MTSMRQNHQYNTCCVLLSWVQLIKCKTFKFHVHSIFDKFMNLHDLRKLSTRGNSSARELFSCKIHEITFSWTSSFFSSKIAHFSFYLQAAKQFLELVNQRRKDQHASPVAWNSAIRFLMARKFDVRRAVELYYSHEVGVMRDQGEGSRGCWKFLSPHQPRLPIVRIWWLNSKGY